jgi:hypothetical protein
LNFSCSLTERLKFSKAACVRYINIPDPDADRVCIIEINICY